MYFFNKQVAYLASVSCFLLLPNISYSLSITADTSYETNGSTINGPTGPSGLFLSGPQTARSGEVRSSGNEQDGGYFISSEGQDSGDFALSSEADSFIADTFIPSGQLSNSSASASFLWQEDFTNSSGSIQNFDFTLNIKDGFLVAGDKDNPAFSPGTPRTADTLTSASFSLEVLLNGTSIWNTETAINRNRAGATSQTQNNNALGGSFFNGPRVVAGEDGESRTVTGYGYAWGASSITLNLGTFNINENFDLSYRATVSTGVNSSPTNTSTAQGLFAIANFADPVSISQRPIYTLTTSDPVISVYEPSAFLLLLTSFGLMFVRRKNT